MKKITPNNKKNIITIIILNVFLVIIIVFVIVYFYFLNWYDNHCIYDSLAKEARSVYNQKDDSMCKTLDKYFPFFRNEIW